MSKVPYYFGDPRRGDVIVFENPNAAELPDRGVIGGVLPLARARASGSAQPENEDFIKRVIGLPGETVDGPSHGNVYVDGEPIDEPYLTQQRRRDDFPLHEGARRTRSS